MKKFKFLALGLVAMMLASCGPTNDPTISGSDPSVPTNPSTEPSEEPTVSPLTTPITIDPTTSEDPTIVPLKDFTVSKNDVSLLIGEQLTVIVSVSDFTFEVADPLICSFNSRGAIKALDKGSTTITISKEGYNSQVINVTVGAIEIEIDGTYYLEDFKFVINESTIEVNESVFNITSSSYERIGNYYFETVTAEFNESSVTIKFEIDEYSNKKYKVTYNGYVLNPSIEELTGSYSYYGETNKNDVYLTFGDYFNEELNAFDVGVSLKDYDTENYSANSYFTIFKGEKTVAIDLIDQDGYYSYSLLKNKDTNALHDFIYNMDILFEDIGFLYTDLHDVYGVYKDLSFDGTNITYKGESYTPKVVHQENKGFYIEISEVINIEITPYGVYINDNEDTFELIREYYTFSRGVYFGESVIIDLATFDKEILINSMFLDSNPAIIDHKIGSYLGTASSEGFEERASQLLIIDENTALIIKKKTGTSVLPDFEYCVSGNYINTYLGEERKGINNSVIETLNVEVNYRLLSITLNGNSYTGIGKYDAKNKTAYLEFNDGTSVYTLKKSNPSRDYIEVYKSGVSYCHYFKELPTFPHEFKNSKLDTLTFNSDYTLNINDLKTTYTLLEKESLDLSNPTYQFILSSSNDVYEYYLDNITVYSEGLMVDNYVESSFIKNISGSYGFNGPYGVEEFNISSDYILSADTLIDGLLKKVTYDYNFMILMHNNKKTLTLLIDYNGVTVYAYLNEFVLEVMSTPYLKDALLYAQGIYRDENNNVIYVKNDILYLNGTANKCSEINGNIVKFGDSKNFIVNVADNDFLTFTNTIHYQNESGESTIFNQINFDLKSLVGSYKDSTVGNISIKESTNPFTGLGEGLELTYSGGTISTYTVVIYENSIAMKFEDFSYSFTVYLDQTSGSLTVSVESKGVLPPPPPPPAPPII